VKFLPPSEWIYRAMPLKAGDDMPKEKEKEKEKAADKEK
jgi:hypothetical protein